VVRSDIPVAPDSKLDNGLEDELDNKKAADPGEGSAAWRAGLMVSQTGNPQGEVPLLSRPASGVVTTYCLIWVWSVAGLRFCVSATVWCCAVVTAAVLTAVAFMAAALIAAVVGRHIAAAVVPLPSSPDMANPGANAIALVTVRTTAHHLPFSGNALSGVPSPTVTSGQATANAAKRATYLLGIYLRSQGSRIQSTGLDELHSSSTSAA